MSSPKATIESMPMHGEYCLAATTFTFLAHSYFLEVTEEEAGAYRNSA
jgi:hypothetical protein